MVGDESLDIRGVLRLVYLRCDYTTASRDAGDYRGRHGFTTYSSRAIAKNRRGPRKICDS